MDTININTILNWLSPDDRIKIRKFISLAITPSTQDEIKKLIQHYPNTTQSFICMAKQQTHGQGQRGKIWTSPPGNLYLSLSYPAPHKLEGLSIKIGKAVIQALQSLIPDENMILKFPNDLYYNHPKLGSKKLGGILIEKIGKQCVIGIGLNIENSPIDTAIDLKSIALDHPPLPDIHQLIALLLHFIFKTMALLLKNCR